jgi:hypothetical protein
MHPCSRFFDDVQVPLDKLAVLRSLLPTLDDAAIPRETLITILYIVRDYHEELSETIELYAREGGSDDRDADLTRRPADEFHRDS